MSKLYSLYSKVYIANCIYAPYNTVYTSMLHNVYIRAAYALHTLYT